MTKKQQNKTQQKTAQQKKTPRSASSKRNSARTAFADPVNRLSGGTRRLTLTDPARLDYVSQGLTDISGYTLEDLYKLYDGEYARIVHPDDRERFLAFDAEMRKQPTMLSLQYRIVCKDGSIVTVQDTMNSHAMPDGSMVGYSLVAVTNASWLNAVVDASPSEEAADAARSQAGQDFAIDAQNTERAAESAADSEMNDEGFSVVDEANIPFGMVVFDADQKNILGCNERFWAILGSSDENDDIHRRANTDPFALIPAVDQRRFMDALRTANDSDEPITFETHMWHSAGYLVEVAGWLSRVPEEGEFAYRLSIVDVTRERNRQRVNRRELRIKHFVTIYDALFLFDVPGQTAQCYSYPEDAPFDTSGHIRIMLPDAVEHILNTLCTESSRQDLEEFFSPLYKEGEVTSTPTLSPSADVHVSQLDNAEGSARRRFRIVFDGIEEGQPVRREAVLLDAEAGGYFFGCRKTAASDPDAGLFANNVAEGARENQQGGQTTLLVAPTCDSGVFSFAVTGDNAELQFSDIRSSSFFHGLDDVRGTMPLAHLLEHTPLSDAQFERLQDDGELTLVDARADRQQRAWRLLCKRDPVRSGGDSHIFGFEVPLWAAHATDEEAESHERSLHEVRVKTFGYFDVFVDGRAVVFSSAKSKELLALLVDRRGGFVSAVDAIAHLWEDEPATSTVLARHRKIAMRLKNTLADYGIEHIVQTSNGQRCLDVDAVSCDLYDYLAGKPEVTFPGTYMQNYSWGEVTLGELLTTMPFH